MSQRAPRSSRAATRAARPHRRHGASRPEASGQPRNGWYGFFEDVDATAAKLAMPDSLTNELDRPAELGSLEISVTPPGPVDRDVVRRYEDLGVDRLVVVRDFADISIGGDEDAAIAYLESTAEELGLG